MAKTAFNLLLLILALGSFCAVGNAGTADEVPVTCQASKTIAMTFDDGPGLALDKYLDAFKNQKVQVTFHFNPPVISSFRSGVNVVKRAVEEGHIIGLRFNPAMNAMQMSNTELAKELAAQSETIQKVTGKYPKYVRFSYQQYDDRVVNIASVMGFTVTSHSIDSGDYRFANFSGAPGGEIHKVYYDQLEQNKGGSFIALHHDLNAAAAAITEDLIANVKARGFKVINMQECLGDSAAYRGDNNVPSDKVLSDAAKSTTKPPAATGASSAFISAPSVMLLGIAALAMLFV